MRRKKKKKKKKKIEREREGTGIYMIISLYSIHYHITVKLIHHAIYATDINKYIYRR